jgi:hypothetical protein
MSRSEVANYIRIFAFTIFSISSILTILVYPTCEPIPITMAQQEKKDMSGTHITTKGGLSNQSIESVMGTLISPKSLMASAISQIRNGASKNNTLAHANSGITIVRDSYTVLLSHQILPPKDFIHIYDSTPYKIMNGHLTAKLPCDSNFESPVEILVGELTNLKPAKLEIVKELSKPGYMCVYYTTLISSGLLAKSGVTTITDITLFNHTGYRVVLLNTSTLVVGINEIMPLSNKMQ